VRVDRRGVVVPEVLMRIAAVVATRVHVDDRRVELGYLVQQPVPDWLRDGAALADG
jgi:hypothetical protein